LFVFEMHTRDLSLLQKLRRRGSAPKGLTHEEPIRAELFSIERLEQHATTLARAQEITPFGQGSRRLAPRLHENARILLDAYHTLAIAAPENRAVTPAAEWLLDNFHIVEEQVREIRDDLPPGYYRKLPKLARGPLKGYPRIFGLAWAFVAHTDSVFDLVKLSRFLEAYQRVQPLTIGELWAVAITLRIALVENLRRLAEAILMRRAEYRRADEMADRILGTGGNGAEDPESLLRQYANDDLPAPFAAQLSQRLRDQDPKIAPVLFWLEERLAAQGTTAERVLAEEHRYQGQLNVTVRNVITSMRNISNTDWAKFFESVSLVDGVLAAGSNFKAMDFATRNRYRRSIEQLADGSELSELEIAHLVVETAAKAPANPASDVETARVRDPGYYLTASGRRKIEAAIEYRPPATAWLSRVHATLGISFYLGAILTTTAVLLAIALGTVAAAGVTGIWMLTGLGFVGLVPASDVAIALVNRVATRRFGPLPLPALELADGVPPDLRTIVVVPTLLTTPETIGDQVHQLEVHFLANPDKELQFALLSDWTDSATEIRDGDDELLAIARAGIADLNRRYPRAGATPRFFLLHRRRFWNESEGKWMGWERKRGKLHELNRLLRGAKDTGFIGLDEKSLPRGVRYVVTLDADTRLFQDAVRKLVGKMAHPLNRPIMDTKSGRVVRGYAVLQPRVTPSLPFVGQGSFFQRVFSGPKGIDPYALAISDIYQDLFEEGSYCGKGIYDIDAFEAALENRIPENAVLSHDLLEGTFARAGLASDVEVVEEFPSRYDVAAARQHRWVRGDWQLLPWIFANGSGAKRTSTPFLGRWKMFDNLRRSLLTPAMLVALFCGWTLPPEAATAWTGFMLGAIGFPLLLPFLAGIIPLRKGISKRSHFRGLAADLWLALEQFAFSIAFLAHQAWLMCDAILRTLYRMCVSRRHLLEWVTAAQTKTIVRDNPYSSLRQIFYASLFIAAGCAFVQFYAASSWPLAAPLFLLWLGSPFAARWASYEPTTRKASPLSARDAIKLRLISRRTWRFFEVFITPEDNMLPPDNFQETPNAVVAHRSSPTNFGMYLLSVIAARDFGWIGKADMLTRLEATLASMEKLHQFRGHFYNWYDTQTLKPLHPEYVSSVDSGNLAGHLIVLAHACRDAAREIPGLSPHYLSGVKDNLALLRECSASAQWSGMVRWEETLVRFEFLLTNRTGGVSAPEDLMALVQCSADIAQMAREAVEQQTQGAEGEVAIWAQALQDCVLSHKRDLELFAAQGDLDRRLHAVADLASSMQSRMNFAFLYDRERELLSIGYRVAENALDSNVYDLLASEARLASFIAIAKGDLPSRHWFRLGRTMTPIGRGSALISWSGSMFEYLMPTLVMREPAGGLIERTNVLAVERQIHYATQLGVPWGISESQFNARDLEMTYQYSSFGVPDLAYKRGLTDNTVIAPYASGLAAMVDPAAAVRNYERMAELGGRGRYGWYEALDFTERRLPEGETVAIVRAYMAHHQGMSLVAAANALLDGIMRTRFHAEPSIQAVQLLLQERMPRDAAVARTPREVATEPLVYHQFYAGIERHVYTPHTPIPRTHLLSNGTYSVMVTSGGSGYSRWGDIAITRWREDATLDNWGSYIYLRDLRSGDVWSAGYQPVGVEPDEYEALFSEDKAEIVRHDGTLKTTLEVAVSSEDDGEVRRVSITNLGGRTREIELTSYAEIVLARAADDAAHPAFSKLFVQTEFVPELGAILATRRKRSPKDPEIWAAHIAVVDGQSDDEPQFETDRARFLGRGQDNRTPKSVYDGWPLSNTAGTVLDPIFSIRRRVLVPRDATVHVTFWTLAAPSRKELLDLIDKHKEPAAFVRATTLAWTQAQVQLHHFGIGPDEAHLFQRLANRVIFSDPALRPTSEVLKRSSLPISALWAHGISGDLPIVLVSIDSETNLSFIRQILVAHEYWRMKRLAVDLVILNEQASSYMQHLQDALHATVQMSRARPAPAPDSPGGNIIVLRADLVPSDVRNLLRCTARVVLHSAQGALGDQLRRAQDGKVPPLPVRPLPSTGLAESAPQRPQLEFFNGLGGFAANGTEYVTVLEGGECTPAPWINVVANPTFGFQVSADGAGFTWSLNSQQNQLTPWSNDPVADPIGEILYIRDDETNDIWTATAQPSREKSSYLTRHGHGYSRFERNTRGLALDLLQYVPTDDPVKISRLKIVNRSGRARRLTVTAYAEWVLGPRRADSQHHIVTDIDEETDAMFAQNARNSDFGTRVAFADLAGRQRTWTGDRKEFIGRNGTLERPTGLTAQASLSRRTGGALDPCAALQAPFNLAPNEEIEIVFFLGQGGSRDEARALVKKYRAADLDGVLDEVKRSWNETLHAVEVKTPDRSFDVLMNGWLLYQALVCRVWARAGFYQASGAYGFRDQLQDVMALAVTRPEIARGHILRAASRQFPEGDVQHWWLPGSGRGIRTLFKDDAIWLAHVVAHYVATTGDTGILDEQVPFLEGPVLENGQHEVFFQPTTSQETQTLFEHCARGLDYSLPVGVHGLPLMGGGDWNDGMNRVGIEGKGESVWLGWFLGATLKAFLPLAEKRGDAARAASWLIHGDALRDALEQNGWDGHWYRRAFYDNGSPLGSAKNTECRIDSIAQSWAVISNMAPPERASRAMAAVEKYLLRREEGLLLLFAPPFNKTHADPGYIKGYPPGIRENGGQYTHGALWSAQAFAMLGDGDRAMELLSLLSPITRSNSASAVQRYKVEPYAVCADLYSRPPHTGRGGWTWYTGSAGVMYRIALEYVLGFQMRGDRLLLNPCVPRTWSGFELTFTHRTSRYEITVENPQGVSRGIVRVEHDGDVLPNGGEIPLADDGATHRLRIVMGREAPPNLSRSAMSPARGKF